MIDKHYVSSGDLKVCILANTAYEACRNALAHPACHNGITLDERFMFVDRRGFRDRTTAEKPMRVIAIAEVVGSCEE